MKTCSIEIFPRLSDHAVNRRLHERLGQSDKVKSQSHKMETIIALCHALLERSDQLYNMSQSMELDIREKMHTDINSMRTKARELIEAASKEKHDAEMSPAANFGF